jgi:tRNA (guanine-N7-)-methyltransferase
VRQFAPHRIPYPPVGPVALPSGPICIEVGAGQGLFAVQFSQANPEKTLIAIERTQERFAKLHQRLINNHCQNVIPIRANAVNWITHCLPEKAVEEYFFLYPNPYPKPSQQNKRFHRMPFMAYLLKTLKPHGRLTIATNQQFYYQEARTFMTEVWAMACLVDRRINRDEKPRTHFEKKYLERGDTCWELVFTK